MKLTKQDVAGMVGIIQANYTYAYKGVTKDDMLMLIETWYTSLARYEKEVVGVAFQRALESCKMPPTLADIVQHIKTIKTATEPTETELWEQLNETLRKVAKYVYMFSFSMREANGLTQGDNARIKVKALWENLPQVLKNYCGNERGLIDLSRLDKDELAFEKGRFIKILPTLKTRIEIQQTIDAGVLRLAGETLKELGSIDLLPLTDTKK